ncbi:hypothetical protein [Streptococcus marmotae]|uniref:hypothetical protein n=1 Tax=Streptococcus marmotae TaxID=1825069 RepID=UPI000829F76C|nr:hypothetical protein [Streptococcus marmotae]
MKYHIDAQGKVSRCITFFKPCPYTLHFDTQSEGQRYLSEWEDNRLHYPEFANEEILEPNHKLLAYASEFKDKKYFEGIETNESTFAIIKTENTEERLSEEIIKLINEDKIEIENIGRASSVSKWVGFRETTDDLAKTSLEKVEEGDMYEARWRGYYKATLVDLVSEPLNNQTTVDIAQHFGYIVSDIYINKNSTLRVFTREHFNDYDFSDYIE